MKNEIKVIKQNPIEFLDPQMVADPIGAINYFHHLSKEAGRLSTQAAAVAGLLLIQLRSKPDSTFSELVEQFDFSRSTAYNYIRVASSIWGDSVEQKAIEFSGLDKRDKASFLTNDVQLVGAKELRNLYSDLGIMQASKMGGKREGAGRKANSISYEDRVALANSELSVLIANIEEFRRSHKLAFIENPDVIARSVEVLDGFVSELRETRRA